MLDKRYLGLCRCTQCSGLVQYSFLRRWPLPSCVQDAQYPHSIIGRVIDQNVVLMHDQLARTGDTTESAQARMIGQAGSLTRITAHRRRVQLPGYPVQCTRESLSSRHLPGGSRPASQVRRRRGTLIRLHELPPHPRPPGGGLGLDFLSRNHITGVGGVDTDLHLASKPGIMLGGFSLLCRTKSRMKPRRSWAPVRSRDFATAANSFSKSH